ncbi:unnamed protein product [Calicophoron daubneyi]|uniref:Aquaporin n=1 Tax=Calicophoron daubneyi TaxID=300641 RepID=A0AAV2SWL8_CALDB
MEENQTRFQLFVDRLRLRSSPAVRACLAEFFGTIILMLLGTAVGAQVFLGNQGRWAFGSFISVSLGWGMAVMFGVFFSGVSGDGHLNPAITIAFACIGKFPIKRVIWYILSQMAGAFIGALCVFAVYREKIAAYVSTTDGGKYLVETTGGIFVTNPSASHWTCFLDQVVGTGLLAASVLAVTDPKGWQVPKWLQPLYIGLLIYTIIGCLCLNCGAALNPARDLSPRLMLLICGWGGNAFTAANYYFWIPILGPIVGAVVGSVLYELVIGIHLDTVSAPTEPGKIQMARMDFSGEIKNTHQYA